MGKQEVHFFAFLGVSLYFLLIEVLCVQSKFSYPRCERIKRINTTQYALRFPRYGDGDKEPCLMTYQAPTDHKIRAECNLESLDCPRDNFYFYDDIHGDSELVCGKLNFTKISSLNTVSIMFDSNITSGSSIECNLFVVAPSDTCSCGWYKDSGRADDHTANPSAISILKVPGSDGLFPYWELICTGIIISHYYILTSATCLTDVTSPNNLFAFTNDANYTKGFDDIKDNLYEIKEIHRHRDYNPQTKVSDISILKIAKPIEWTKRIGPVCLPNIRDISNNVAKVDIIGYKKNFPEQRYQLQKLQVEITPFSIYQNYSLSQFSFEGNMNQELECRYGGPMILNSNSVQILYGITSNLDCSLRVRDLGFELINLATDIIAHYRWIFAVTGEYCVHHHHEFS